MKTSRSQRASELFSQNNNCAQSDYAACATHERLDKTQRLAVFAADQVKENLTAADVSAPKLSSAVMNRKSFLKVFAVAGAALPCWFSVAEAKTGKCDGAACMSDASAVRQFLTDFLSAEDATLDHDALLKLMQQRGRACCRALDFRQKLIEESHGSVDKLVELMGKIVGAENCRREGDTVTLIYPTGKCVCGWNPQRPVSPHDPYCDCSAANNQLLFETVSGNPVNVKVAESPRRGGSHCRFIIHLS
jgi:hypothetical protein